MVWLRYKLPINGRVALRWVSFAFCFALLLKHADVYVYTYYAIVVAIECRIFYFFLSPTRRMLNFWRILLTWFLFCLSHFTGQRVAILFWIVRALHSNAAKACPPTPSPAGLIRSSVVLNLLRFLWVSSLCLPLVFIQNKIQNAAVQI